MSTLYESGYQQFRCTGADCEDTCCTGWRINIDKATYHEYENSQNPVIKEMFGRAIQRDTDAESDHRYASFVPDSTGSCPFLDHGLCRIHSLLGPQALASLCASFPRVMNLFGTQEEYSLDLSCPEAARLILLNTGRIGFQESDSAAHEEGGNTKRRPPHFQLSLDPDLTAAVNEIRKAPDPIQTVGLQLSGNQARAAWNGRLSQGNDGRTRRASDSVVCQV